MKKLLTLFCFVIFILNNNTITAKAEEGVAGISVILDKINTTVTYSYTTDRVNLRKEASTNSDIVLTLDKRVEVTVLKKTSSDNWVKVIYNKKVGYINEKYLRNTKLPSIDFTDEDIDLIAKIIWLESRGESDKGMAAVVNVIINRVLHIEFSDTIYDVLSSKGEFSSWKLLDTAKPTKREYEIINEVINGEWRDLLDKDYVYFGTKARNNKGTIQIGNHFFCKY